MAWLALKLLGAGRWALGLLGGLLDWLLAKPIRAVLLLFALHVAAHQFVIDPRMRAERDEWKLASTTWQDAAGKWQQAHGAVLQEVRRKSAEAAELDRQNAAQVAREQAVIIEETANAYEDLLADSRAAAGQLRDQLAAIGSSGSAGDGSAAPVPGDLTARCQAFGAADCDALLAALPHQLSEAEANTNKLIPLQAYVRRLLGIDFNGEGE